MEVSRNETTKKARKSFTAAPLPNVFSCPVIRAGTDDAPDVEVRREVSTEGHFSSGLQHQVKQRRRPALSAPIQRNLVIHHVGDIPAFGKKLHDFMTCAGQFRPARSGSRVLFEAAYFLAVEGEVHLAQPVLGGAADRKV